MAIMSGKKIPLVITPITEIGMINRDDQIIPIVLSCLDKLDIVIEDGDILVFAQKIISKSEGRVRYLSQYQPSDQAISMAQLSGKDPRFVEAVLQESNEILRVKSGTIIAEHKNGFICANAGIDHSNVIDREGESDEVILLLPENPDLTAKQYQASVKNLTKRDVGILIIDSHGRAWRNGSIGMTIGLAGVPGLVDLRGHKDLFGYELKVTQTAAADQLAAAASLMMGETDEGVPVVHVRGFPYSLRASNLKELIRNKEQDMFR